MVSNSIEPSLLSLAKDKSGLLFTETGVFDTKISFLVEPSPKACSKEVSVIVSVSDKLSKVSLK